MRVLTILVFSLLTIYANAQIISKFLGAGIGGGVDGLGDGLYKDFAITINPVGGVFDKFGNYFFVEGTGNRIRKVDTLGIVSCAAGTGVAGYYGDNGLAIDAKLNQPTAIAIDTQGNIYISDGANHRIRKVTVSTGIISTIAGTGIPGYNGENILASSAMMNSPADICFDLTGNLLVADLYNNRIRKIDVTTGIINTIAGSGIQGFAGDSGIATNAELSYPNSLTIDNNGNIYILDNNNVRIRKIDTSGTINTIAGTGNVGFYGDNGPAISAKFNFLGGKIGINEFEELFIADTYNNRIRKINSFGIINTVVGTGVAGYGGDGGLASASQIYYPSGLSFDKCGNLFIPHTGNPRIRKVWFNTDTIPQVNVAITPNDTVITGTQVTNTATVPTGTITGYQWVKNGANASTNSTYTYTPTNGDSVYCIVTVRACTGRMYTDTTQVMHITVTGDAGIANTTKSTIHTYPNPVTDVLHVATTEALNYVLHNLMGVTLLQGSVDKQNSIDMKAIPSGIYLLQLTNTQGQREVLRVVKE